MNAASVTASAPVLAVDDLTARFVSRDATVHAVNGVSLRVAPREVLCIIGESGSGKSVTLRALMRLLPADRTRLGGSIRIDGTDVLALGERQLSMLRGATVSMVFQEPMTALDPVYTIGEQIVETIVRHRRVTRREAQAQALALLEHVRVPSPQRRLRAYPHELSGGLRQRAMIAIALSCRPRLLLADEPTTALDATVQIQTLVLLKQLQAQFGTSIVIVTHDLGVAAQIADMVAVMYAGQIVEYGAARDVLLAPQHPYTRAMLASTVAGRPRELDLETIAGGPPDLRALPPGCAFAARCPRADTACSQATPPPHAAHGDGYVRCIHIDGTSRSGSEALAPADR
ncbi:ABC transporter ATP-binding protein [Paraburkholderia sp. SARCC-3016]|uniref:ABC transporter ATP-binding protein n=1 Tax=Paraburkholderia sp. SARCC-3016 TaxID=3058611 RepID=UPI00280720CC|nr:ABC transporter ATP-binding protein [Paraburkholderia sp. SARCC-3016]MDQ7978831.1 ABC transporter ATP-binding protein [Paraburkholderia sp. SARCC-3016]